MTPGPRERAGRRCVLQPQEGGEDHLPVRRPEVDGDVHGERLPQRGAESEGEVVLGRASVIGRVEGVGEGRIDDVDRGSAVWSPVPVRVGIEVDACAVRGLPIPARAEGELLARSELDRVLGAGARNGAVLRRALGDAPDL